MPLPFDTFPLVHVCTKCGGEMQYEYTVVLPLGGDPYDIVSDVYWCLGCHTYDGFTYPREELNPPPDMLELSLK